MPYQLDRTSYFLSIKKTIKLIEEDFVEQAILNFYKLINGFLQLIWTRASLNTIG